MSFVILAEGGDPCRNVEISKSAEEDAVPAPIRTPTGFGMGPRASREEDEAAMTGEEVGRRMTKKGGGVPVPTLETADSRALPRALGIGVDGAFGSATVCAMSNRQGPPLEDEPLPESDAASARVADAVPANFVYRVLPERVRPYAQLARWDRPIGWQLLLWPCWWSAALGPQALAPTTLSTGLPNPWHLVLFLVGAVAMRGAGCTYNDLVDEEIDGRVARTRSRPLPSGRVSRRAAKLFLALQALAGLLVLVQFNLFAIVLGIASLGIVAIYPFLKRVTDWPQLGLGFAFSWGALMGWAAVFGGLSAAPLLLYAGCIAWTVGYDTIYAHQDKEDDALIGVGSTARLFGRRTKPALALLYALTILCFALAFAATGVAPRQGPSWPAYLGLAAGAGQMLWQIRALDIDDPDECLRLFRSNALFGWIVFFGLVFSALWTLSFPVIR